MKTLKKILMPIVSIIRPVKIFLNNVLYLFKYDIKAKSISSENINCYLDNIKYEIEDDLINLKRPKIASVQETIDKIIIDNISIARFGDGEFELIFNRSIPFQISDIKLSERLKEVLKSDLDQVAIGIPLSYWHTVNRFNPIVKDFVRKNISVRRKEYEKYINFEKQYYCTDITQMYMTQKTDDIDIAEYFEQIKKIWFDRDVTIIQGKNITRDFKFNIFEKAKSVDYMEAPAMNAFSEYDSILEKAKQISKNRLVLIILGPTATVLAYDLAKEGYQALDMGHIAKDYDCFKKGIVPTSSNITKFYLPE
jgi:glycosyltransferase family protein